VTTADIVMNRALALAGEPTEEDIAVKDLLECCGDRRVSVVLAHRYLTDRLAKEPDPQTARAAELVERVLRRLDGES
jgi:hypothetical protein